MSFVVTCGWPRATWGRHRQTSFITHRMYGMRSRSANSGKRSPTTASEEGISGYYERNHLNEPYQSQFVPCAGRLDIGAWLPGTTKSRSDSVVVHSTIRTPSFSSQTGLIAYRICSTDDELKCQICCFFLCGEAPQISCPKNGGKKCVRHILPSKVRVLNPLRMEVIFVRCQRGLCFRK